jgi:ribulose-5-phosphate 4-epimerase/fuculose-1-phosphate aldolase
MMKEYIKEFIKQAHRYGDDRLMQCSSGNLSLRVGEKVIISSTGSWLPKIKESQIALLDLESGETLNGVKPSMEHGFHLGVLRKRDDCDVVFHFQSPYATAVACLSSKVLNFNVIAEIPCHIGSEIPQIPYFCPGSKELAEAVTEGLRVHNLVLLTNHGVVLCAKNFEKAYEMASFFELACSIIINTRGEYSTLSSEDIHDLNTYILGKK